MMYNIPTMFKKQVKCIECGFLGESEIGGWDEISVQTRANLVEAYKDFPISVQCLRGQDHVIAGMPPPGKSINYEALICNSYQPRKCIYYYPHNPGFTPEQHLELLREMKVENESMCSQCSYLSFCEGCIAAAFMLKGNPQCYDPYSCALHRAYDEVIGFDSI